MCVSDPVLGLSVEHQSSPAANMGDMLEFNEIYQEVKGSWVPKSTIFLLYDPPSLKNNLILFLTCLYRIL